MESRAVIPLPQMAELMQENVVAERFREAYQIEIQIDITKTGAASPVREIVLHRHPPVSETIPFRQFRKPGSEI